MLLFSFPRLLSFLIAHVCTRLSNRTAYTLDTIHHHLRTPCSDMSPFPNRCPRLWVALTLTYISCSIDEGHLVNRKTYRVQGGREGDHCTGLHMSCYTAFSVSVPVFLILTDCETYSCGRKARLAFFMHIKSMVTHVSFPSLCGARPNHVHTIALKRHDL